MTLYTVGHSNQPFEAFVDILRDVAIRVVADVRRYPRSRRYPWFSRERLSPALAEAGIAYEHLPDLGGMRDDVPEGLAPDVAGLAAVWRPYAAHAQSAAFAAALERLLDLARSRGPLAFACAERDPEACHRRLLADVLAARGHQVVHLLGAGAQRRHELTPGAVVHGGVVAYPAPQGDLFADG